MSALILGTLGGLMIAGYAVIYAKQALIEDAHSRTGGYF